MNQANLSTARLELIPLSQIQLALYLEREKDFTLQVAPTSREIITEPLRRAILLKLEKMSRAPAADHPWMSYWLIQLRAENYGIGMLGFKGIPDREGRVEIGYGIDPGYQNQGITTEAVKALIDWAFTDPRCLQIIAPGTRRDNPASNRVLRKVGMRIYQETDQALSWCLDRPREDSRP